jgi:hypothetical protein
MAICLRRAGASIEAVGGQCAQFHPHPRDIDGGAARPDFQVHAYVARFYRVLEWGRRAEEAIGLHSALDTDWDMLNTTSPCIRLCRSWKT